MVFGFDGLAGKIDHNTRFFNIDPLILLEIKTDGIDVVSTDGAFRS
jgi:hypothetical protein